MVFLDTDFILRVKTIFFTAIYSVLMTSYEFHVQHYRIENIWLINYWLKLKMSLNLFFMYCAASSCWAGLQATISEHLRTSSGPRGRQQRPHPAGQMQHSPGNVWSSSVRVGDKIKESGVNLTWKKMKLKSLQQFIL